MPFSFHAPEPDAALRVPEGERAERVKMTDETCVIDGKHHFIRALVQLPVTDGPAPFQWGVWVALSDVQYLRALELWDKEGREAEPAYPGTLATDLPTYPPTQGLKVMVHTRPVGQRPLLELAPTEHPLASERRYGVFMSRIREINEFFVHGEAEAEKEEAPPAAEPLKPPPPRAAPPARRKPSRSSTRWKRLH